MMQIKMAQGAKPAKAANCPAQVDATIRQGPPIRRPGSV